MKKYAQDMEGIIVSEIDLLIQELRDTIDNQKEEIDRLNNIIDELEKWLNELKDMESFADNLAIINTILDKLKELKENK